MEPVKNLENSKVVKAVGIVGAATMVSRVFRRKLDDGCFPGGFSHTKHDQTFAG
jgi:hypothetical protein